MEIGQPYIVSCAITTIRSFHNGRPIPIYGKPHDDEELGVPFRHYHIDWRFMNEYDKANIPARGGHHNERDYYFLVVREDAIVKIEDMLMIYYGDFEPFINHANWIWKLHEIYKDVQCKGKKCPHKGADLSNCIADNEGDIFCPYHGMRINQETMTVKPFKSSNL